MMGWQWRLLESIEPSFMFRLWATNLPCLCVSSRNLRKLGLCGTHLGHKNPEERKLKVFCQVILCWIQNLDQRVQIPSPKSQPLKVPYSEVKSEVKKKNYSFGGGACRSPNRGESLFWKFLIWLWNTIRDMGQGNLTDVMTYAPLASSLQKGGGEDSVRESSLNNAAFSSNYCWMRGWDAAARWSKALQRKMGNGSCCLFLASKSSLYCT